MPTGARGHCGGQDGFFTTSCNRFSAAVNEKALLRTASGVRRFSFHAAFDNGRKAKAVEGAKDHKTQQLQANLQSKRHFYLFGAILRSVPPL